MNGNVHEWLENGTNEKPGLSNGWTAYAGINLMIIIYRTSVLSFLESWIIPAFPLKSLINI